MALSAVLSNHFKYALANKLLDLATGGDTLKCLLMRSGFVFNKDNHAQLNNIKGTITASTIEIEAGLTIHDTGGGFTAAGFVAGNSITISGFTTEGNNGVKTILSRTGNDIITLADTTGMDQEAVGDAVTITADDELATDHGYTQGGVSLGTQSIYEDDTNDRMEFTCADITIVTASGGAVGPTPGALIYDDTEAGKTIIGFFDFDGEQTIADTHWIKITNPSILLT